MTHLVLKLLGPMEMTLAGQPLDCKYDKVRALLAYLAAETNYAHRRESLLGLLWPELPEAAARNNLRQVLAILRAALGDSGVGASSIGRPQEDAASSGQSPTATRSVRRPQGGTPTFLLADRTTVQFRLDAGCWLDVAVFTELLETCAKHAHRRAESCKICAGRLAQAVALYRGPFLAEFFLPDSEAFEDWATLKREQLHQQMLSALAQLVVYHERCGRYAEALRYARRQLELEPWREETHRQVMRLHVLHGDRSAALAQYRQCQEILAAELDVTPEEATTALYEQILRAGDQMPLAPLAAPAAHPHTLPPQPTPFIGRERELAALGELLARPDCRLVTLAGIGGAGKTRLALRVASEHVDEYADGVFFVALAGLETPDLLAQAMIGALQLQEPASSDPSAYLLAYLRGKELLLVLDNMEGLLGGIGLLADILFHAPEVTLLVTSRERLNLRGEWVITVAGLPVPPQFMPTEPLTEEIESNDAVHLFVQSARRASYGFHLTVENAADIIRICRLVEGLPLAIELAAAWVRVLTCAEIASEIERGIDLFTSNLRDLPERHRSLSAVFHHSWQLLSDEEQTVLRQLSAFGGSFGRESAQQVAGADLPLLTALVDKSLLTWHPTGRYALHSLVRQYAAEQLRSAGEVAETHARHLQYYRILAEMAETKMNGPEQTLWLDRLEMENDNLRAALAWALSAGENESGLMLAVALYPFWYWRNHFREGRNWLAQALSQVSKMQPLSTTRQARALWAAGVLSELQSDYVAAAQFYEQSLALRRSLNDQAGVAASLNSLGALCYRQQRYDQAQSLFAESLLLRRSLGQTSTLGIPLNNLGLTALAQGNYTAAEDYFAEGLALARDADDKGNIATVLNNLGTAMLALRQPDRAQAYLVEGLSLQQELRDKDGLAGCLEGMAVAGLLLAGDVETAVWAAHLLGAAETLRTEVGAPILPIMKPLYENAVVTLRTMLDEATFAKAWAAGQALSLEDAIRWAQTAGQIPPDCKGL